MWTSADTRGCGTVFLVLVLLALVGLGAVGYGIWWLAHHLYVGIR